MRVRTEEFEQYRWVARAVVRRLLPSFQSRYFDRDDAMQEALMGLAQGLSSYRKARGKKVSWLYGRCLNRVLDGYRKVVGRTGTPRNHVLLRTGHAELGDRPAEGDPTRHVDLADEVEAELSRLAPADRRLLRMYYLKGFTMYEVGCALGCPASLVCARHAAIKGASLGQPAP